MPIAVIEDQKRLRELGRIRLGDRSGRNNSPVRLETFRVTSASKDLVTRVSELYGGNVTEWESPRGTEWQVVTDSNEMEIMIPPDQYLEQWYEKWSAGGLQRRCDGVTETLGMKACSCVDDPELRECQPTTRLRLMLPGVPGLGTWRLETHSWNAAVELYGVSSLLAEATARNIDIPAVVRIEQRRSVKDGKTQRYSVPVIDAKLDVGTLFRGDIPDRPAVEPPAEGRRATQRVALGAPEELPDKADYQAEPEDHRPDLGPEPPLPDASQPSKNEEVNVDWDAFFFGLKAGLDERVRGLGDVEVAIGTKPTIGAIVEFMIDNNLEPNVETLLLKLDETWNAKSAPTSELVDANGWPIESHNVEQTAMDTGSETAREVY